MPHARAAEAVGLALSVQPHVGVGMSDTLGRPETAEELEDRTCRGRGGGGQGQVWPLELDDSGLRAGLGHKSPARCRNDKIATGSQIEDREAEPRQRFEVVDAQDRPNPLREQPAGQTPVGAPQEGLKRRTGVPAQ